ncbi:ribosome maturation factor RimM [Leptolyngbya sp. FACHB-261]|uniref:ribosome maturation factor RimM n=1 Tax=Leptolyngbya sp. FACHB-261 TaxID=2692806 RepID=UPI001681E3B1|nr:ribosome maturation factor RimM [Leptolyngbya sp. FACHB-261]MBD2104058.1 ribosome maturation factor RimM [Leptolyngbya sp. FACHB-261]
MDPLTDCVVIGKIIAAQGLRGEVRVLSMSDFPERFENPGKRWLQRSESAPLELLTLRSGRYLPGKGIYVVRFAEITDRDAAESLRGATLLISAAERPTLEDNEYLIQDLLGLSVIHQPTGQLLGTVVTIIPAGNDLLEIEGVEPTTGKLRRTLIPFVEPIAPVVDLAAGRIEVVPPAGLIDEWIVSE